MFPSRSRFGRVLAAVVAALASALILVPMVAAHAELTASSPAANATVQGPLSDPIVLTFSEAVAEGSKFEVVASDGSTLGNGTVDPNDATKLAWTPSTPLAAGAYEVRWTSIADDGHVERGTFTFTVTAASASASAEASAEPSATAGQPASPAATASAVPSPTAATTDPTDSAGSSGSAFLPIVVALVIVAGLGAYLLRRRGAGDAR
jgi:methionine-rich copper-binding protein CopC